MKTPCHLAAVTVLFLGALVSKASEKCTANFLYADPYGHLDQAVVVQVVSVHPEHYESKVRDVVWFRAHTGTKESRNGQFHLKPGGEIMVAVDSSGGADFFHTYGEGSPVRSDGFIPTHSLTGIFRASDRLLKADPNKRRVDQVDINNGSYFIDCTTKAQFKNVEYPSSSPSPSPDASPTPDASPSPSPDATASPSPSPSPSALYNNIKALINRLGIQQ